MSFAMIILNQSIGTTQNCATWIQIGLSCILKLKIFEDIANDFEKNI